MIDLVKRYTIKYDRKIKRICSPLEDKLDIPFFSHYQIDRDGQFFIISNYPDQLEYYYSQKLYLTNPFFIDPHLQKSGSVFVYPTLDQDTVDTIRKRFDMNKLFLQVERTGDQVEGFIFADKNLEVQTSDYYLPKLDLLKKFTCYFKQQTKDIIMQMKSDGYNILKERKDLFYQCESSNPLTIVDKQSAEFLKQILPLSHREQQCLELFKKGNSSQSTAAILGLSQRTVENYFENIKNKLGCSSKRDLLDW